MGLERQVLLLVISLLTGEKRGIGAKKKKRLAERAESGLGSKTGRRRMNQATFASLHLPKFFRARHFIALYLKQEGSHGLHRAQFPLFPS